MARIVRTEYGDTKIWLSANDTYNWAHKPGSSWPCSKLSGHRVFAEFASNGDLFDIAIDGKYGKDCPSSEFNAIMDDFLKR
jgi:hypothetical protein